MGEPQTDFAEHWEQMLVAAEEEVGQSPRRCLEEEAEVFVVEC